MYHGANLARNVIFWRIFKGNCGIYKKIDENCYALINKPNDPYVNETLIFNYTDKTITGFNQGGWGFSKI